MKRINGVFIAALILGVSNLAFSQVSSTTQQRAASDYNESIREMDAALAKADQQNMFAARKDFVAAFTQAQDAIVAGKLDKAKKSVEKLHKFTNTNKYEESRVYLIDYWYQGQLGNKEAENEAAMKLMPIGFGNVDAEAFVEAGIRLLKRQYNGQNFGGAIDTLGYLRQEPKSMPELDSITSAVKKLDDISASNQDVVQQIKTDDKGQWNAKLLRPTFFMDKVNGEVSTIDFNCENKQSTLPYKAESVMSTPASWGKCSIKVNATPNTTFDFAQLVNKPAA